MNLQRGKPVAFLARKNSNFFRNFEVRQRKKSCRRPGKGGWNNKLPIYGKMDKKTKNIILTRYYASPCGRLLLGARGEYLCLCDWETAPHRDRVGDRLRRLLSAEFREGDSPVLAQAAAWLDGYFAGERTPSDLPLLFAGTDFQKRVWNALRGIPYGETISYGELASKLGIPSAVRAVANANGANALSVFVPCHRVIGRDLSLTGYAGGLPAKEYLLRLEGARFNGGCMRIETSRLLLRPWCPEDALALYRYASDGRVSELALWPRHTSPEMSRRVIEEFFMPNPFTFAVTLKETGEPVGCIGLVPKGDEHYCLLSGEREVGYWIGRPFWGQGLIPEALEALGAFCRDRLGLTSLLITADARNRASIRVAEKCGFLFFEEYLFEGIPSRAYRKTLS